MYFIMNNSAYFSFTIDLINLIQQCMRLVGVSCGKPKLLHIPPHLNLFMLKGKYIRFSSY